MSSHTFFESNAVRSSLVPRLVARMLKLDRPVDKRGLAPQLTVRLRREGTRERTRKKQVRSVGAQALLLGGEPYSVILANSS